MIADKISLNNEIIQCRPVVRKAKVRVIRKKIKQIKILNSCKNEELKEKRLKKAQRLVEEVNILKKIIEDEVIKFALRNSDLDEIVKKTASNEIEHAYAFLAGEKEVKQKIELIKSRIPPDIFQEMLKTLLATRVWLKRSNTGNKVTAKRKKKESIVSKEEKEMRCDNEILEESKGEVEFEVGGTKSLPKRKEKMTGKMNEEKPASDGKQKGGKIKMKNKEIEGKLLEENKVEKIPKNDSAEVMDNPSNKVIPEKLSLDQNREVGFRKRREIKSSSSGENVNRRTYPKKEETSEKPEKIKIEDPFFVGKKVSLPKLLLEELKEDPTKEIKFNKDEILKPRPMQFNKRREFSSREFPTSKRKLKPREIVRQPQATATRAEENLHPSWAAKRKINEIQPFQGKKIKFNDD